MSTLEGGERVEVNGVPRHVADVRLINGAERRATTEVNPRGAEDRGRGRSLRDRRTPAWLADYNVGEESEEEA